MVKIRRQFQAAFQQMRRVFQVAETYADRRQDAHCGGIQRILFQNFTREPLGMGHVSLAKKFCRLDHLRMPGDQGEVTLVSFLALRLFAGGAQLVTQGSPRGGVSGIQFNGALQGYNGLGAFAQRPEAHPALMLEGCRFGVPFLQWTEQGQGAGSVPLQAIRYGQQLACTVMLRVDTQDFEGLRFGIGGRRTQQCRSMFDR
jgi:hypothetical protein